MTAGFTAIFTREHLLLLPFLITLDKEITSFVRKLYQKWREYTINVQLVDGLYTVIKDNKRIIGSPKHKPIYTDSCLKKEIIQERLIDTTRFNLQMDRASMNDIFRLHSTLGHISTKNLTLLNFHLTDHDKHQINTCLTDLAVNHRSKSTTKLKDKNREFFFQYLPLDTTRSFTNGSTK